MYLSIDIDFWNCLGVDNLIETLELVRDSGKLRQVCDNHRCLLKSVNKSGCTTLINVDTHSDIVSDSDLEYLRHSKYPILNCGTWVNHVNKCLRSEFVWFYPKDYGLRCETEGNPFAEPEKIGWKTVQETPVSLFPIDLIADATDIGIAVSYYWLERELTKEKVQWVFKKVFDKVPQHKTKNCH